MRSGRRNKKERIKQKWRNSKRERKNKRGKSSVWMCMCVCMLELVRVNMLMIASICVHDPICSSPNERRGQGEAREGIRYKQRNNKAKITKCGRR